MNESVFYYGAGGARGNIVSQPSDLPRWVSEGSISLTVPGPTVHQNTEAGFFTALDNAGAVVNVSAANTWTDIVDIAGAGFLGNVVASHANVAGPKTLGIRVIVDGVQWDWLETITTTSAAGTLVLGAISPAAVILAGVFPSASRAVETADALPLGSYGLAPTSVLMSLGAHVLAFNESLRVRVRNSFTNSSSQGQKAGCSFVLR